MKIRITGHCLIHIRQRRLAEEICKQTAHEVTFVIPRRWSGVTGIETPFHRKIERMKVIPSPTLLSEEIH